MNFQSGRNMTVMAGVAALAGAHSLGGWGEALGSITSGADRYPPRWDDPKPEPVLRHVAIAKAKKKRAAKQARRQRRLPS